MRSGEDCTAVQLIEGVSSGGGRDTTCDGMCVTCRSYSYMLVDLSFVSVCVCVCVKRVREREGETR